MKVLSLFDGMACGMIAMLNGGVQVDEYIAYEIDKYAIQTATHNFPMIKECGDVFKADFTQYKGFDYLIGGSPCTYWSIAQKNNRETEASGMGWELLSQFVRALYEALPMFFIYENNKSMSNAIRQSITQTFGFDPTCINSDLVSAQNRQRLYWVGKRNDDGTYSKVNVEQPEDRGILLKDVLDSAVAWREKAHTIDENYYKGENFTSTNKQIGALPRPNGELSTSQGMRIYSVDGKSVTQSANGGGCGAKTGLYAIPVDDDLTVKESTKAISAADGKEYTVYKVENGKITIKGKTYPIKLVDGYYIIRKLTVHECMRLQTVPEWYEFPVSNSQAYKMLGNGWTCDVITHLIKATMGVKV